MTNAPEPGPDIRAALDAAGLPGGEASAWHGSRPEVTGDFRRDWEACARFWRSGTALFAALPRKRDRTEVEARAAAILLQHGRESRDRFLRTHAEALYCELTDGYRRFVRVEQLVYDASAALPGITPTRDEVAAESALMQGEKDGREVDQGILLSRILGHPKAGAHLCHAMLLPRLEATDHLTELQRRGVVDLGPAKVERRGKASIVTLRNPRFLNAEDDATIDAAEIAADLANLDLATEIAVMIGDVVDHPKFAGRRIFSAGINLTHLYYGKIPYVWYIRRDMGIVNKIFRGVAGPDLSPDELDGGTREKPWVAGVDAFAIGGGCQYLLAMDYVVAASDAYMTLPARKEGIIPGAANLRLPRFVGDRIAREAIMYGRRLDCDSPEGRLICDEVVPPDAVDATIATVVENFTSSGVVSAAGNRRAFRVGQEPLDLFRRYMAVYAREQAYCHFSPALIGNLERHWNAQNRKT